MYRPSYIDISIQKPSSDGLYWGRYPQGNKPVFSGPASIASSASGVLTNAGTIFYQEDYTGLPVGNFSLTSAATAKGYVDFENSGTPSNIQILDRSGMPAGLLSNPSFPAGKTRVCRFNLAANEVISRITWAGLTSPQARLSTSWHEYRSSAQVGGEKLHRVGNFVVGVINDARGIDSIVTYGQLTGLTLIANSLNMHAYGDHGLTPGISGWPPGLVFIEVVTTLSTGTNADGSVFVYQNGLLIGGATGLQFFDTLAQAAILLQLFDTGGWSSTGSGDEGPVTYPIVRYWCAFRVASAYQGYWPLSAV